MLPTVQLVPPCTVLPVECARSRFGRVQKCVEVCAAREISLGTGSRCITASATQVIMLCVVQFVLFLSLSTAQQHVELGYLYNSTTSMASDSLLDSVEFNSGPAPSPRPPDPNIPTGPQVPSPSPRPPPMALADDDTSTPASSLNALENNIIVIGSIATVVLLILVSIIVIAVFLQGEKETAKTENDLSCQSDGQHYGSNESP